MSEVVSSWQYKRIGDFISLDYGRALGEADRSGEGYPVFGSSGEVGNHGSFLVGGPGIILGRKGTVGSVFWSSNSFWPIDTTYYVRWPAGSAVNPRWVYWLLQTLPLRRLDSSTGVPGLNRNDVYALMVFVPPLREQRRIAEILDIVDEAIRSTEQLVAKLESAKQGLLQELLSLGVDEAGRVRERGRDRDQFVHSELGMFPEGWRIAPIGTFLGDIEAGKSPDLPDQPAPIGEWGVLKVSAVRPEGLCEQENKRVTQPSLINPKLEVRDGDLLISRANTPQLVGMVSFVRVPRSGLMLSDKTLRLIFNKDQVLPEFASYALQSPVARRQIEASGTGSSGSMKNISQDEIRGFRLPWPTRAEQERIVKVAEASRLELVGMLRRLTKLRLIKQGLMDDLLTGRVRVNVAEEAVA